MKILCGYANDELAVEIRNALAKFSVDYVDMTGDDFAYWRNISERWTGEKDLIIIEQDVAITSKTIQSLDGCSEHWCLFAYPGPLGKMLYYGLGCTRFSKELQRAVPVSEISTVPLPWNIIDGKISVRLGLSGYTPHIHGEIEHNHDYPEDNSLVAQLTRKGNIDILLKMFEG